MRFEFTLFYYKKTSKHKIFIWAGLPHSATTSKINNLHTARIPAMVSILNFIAGLRYATAEPRDPFSF